MSDDNHSRDEGTATCSCGCPKVGDGCDCRFCNEPYPTPAPHDGDEAQAAADWLAGRVAFADAEFARPNAEDGDCPPTHISALIRFRPVIGIFRPYGDAEIHVDQVRALLAERAELREQLAAANARAEYLDTEALRLRHDTDEARRERDQWREDWRQLRARLDGLGEVTDDMVTAAWEAMGWERAPYMARVSNFTREQIDNGELREANNAAEAANEDLMRRTLAAALAAAPWHVAPDAAADGHSATQTGGQGLSEFERTDPLAGTRYAGMWPFEFPSEPEGGI